MTVILCLALLLVIATRTRLKNVRPWVATVAIVCRAVLILGLALLALLSTGWRP